MSRVGWRFWRLDTVGALRSLATSFTWEGPVTTVTPPCTVREVERCAHQGSLTQTRFWGTRYISCPACGPLAEDWRPLSGLWVMKDRLDAQIERRDFTLAGSPAFVAAMNTGIVAWVLGEVEVWGRLVEHEWGWRAEHALVRVVADVPPVYAAAVGARYHCEVIEGGVPA